MAEEWNATLETSEINVTLVLEHTVNGEGGSGPVGWDDVEDKPTTFPPSVHNHDDLYFTESEVTTALAGKSDTGHNHDDLYFTESEVTTALDAKLATANNLSEIVSPSAARYNIRVPMLFNAVCVYTTNVASLSGTPSATDGMIPSNGENVLLVGQTTQSQNGVWTVNTSGAWTRPADFPTGGTIRSRTIQIASGNLFANSIWGLTATSTITIDTSNQVWSLIGRPTGMFPKLQPASGNWFSQSGQKGSTNAGMGGVGVFQAHPVWLARGTLDRIAVSTTAAAASTWRLGIYKQNPYALTDDPAGLAPLLDAGTVNMNATAGVQAITINQAIEEGIYWLAVLVEAFTAQPSYHCLNYGNNTQPQIFGIPENMSSLGRYNVGKTYGSLISPANVMPTFPSTSMSWSGGVPRIAVRYA